MSMIEEFDENKQRAKIRAAFSGGEVTQYNRPPELTFVRKTTAQEVKNNTGSNTASDVMGKTYSQRRGMGS